MKSLTAVCQTGASMPAINPNGRISRHPPHRGDGENAEMKMYLSKLKDLVPFMPKNRKLSKLEIIQHVIDYICDLQSELETHPEISNFDAAAALNFTANLERVSAANDEDGDDEEDEEMYEGGVQDRLNGSMLQQQQSSPAQRQPLVDRQTPNTILPATQQQQHQQQQHLNVSAISNTTTSNSITTTNSSSGNSSASAVTSSTAVNPTTTTTSTTAAVNTAVASNLTHTLNPEKDLDSRQSC